MNNYKIILDLPSNNPSLGFDQYAEALTSVIENSEPQFAIGIFGGWGSGKTTLMKAIEKRLDIEETIVVNFSAWRYEREEHLIVPLLDAVREALVEWGEKNVSLKKIAFKTAATVGKVIYSLLAGMSIELGATDALKLSLDANQALEKAAEFDEDEKNAKAPRSFIMLVSEL